MHVWYVKGKNIHFIYLCITFLPNMNSYDLLLLLIDIVCNNNTYNHSRQTKYFLETCKKKIKNADIYYLSLCIRVVINYK